MKSTLIDRVLLDAERIDELSGLMAYNPLNRDSLDNQCDILSATKFPRSELGDILSTYNRTIENDSAALANCEKLIDEHATVVITGQQAGLFTGPLYTIYKIVTVIRLARDETGRTGRTVIPVFWNATEDHDISEIASCYFPDKTLHADFPTTGIAGECFGVEVLQDLIDGVVNESPDYIKDEIATLLRCSHDTYGDYSSSVVARLFKGTGLVIVEPRILRPLAISFFTNVITQHDALVNALAVGADAMDGVGLPPSFSPSDGTGLFFINDDGIRRQILKRDAGFLVNDAIVPQSALMDMITSGCQSFSTGAWLRPVLQGALFPVLSYIAGPGEFNYHLQLRGVFEQLNVTMPPIRLRNHATLLGAAEGRMADKLALSVDDYFKGPEPFYSQAELPADKAAIVDDCLSQLSEIGVTLKDTLPGLDCDRTIDGFVSKAEKDLNKVRKRAAKEIQRSAGVGNQRVDRFFQAVFPARILQERRINVFYFLRSFGPSLIADLIESFDPGELRHYIIELGE